MWKLGMTFNISYLLLSIPFQILIIFCLFILCMMNYSMYYCHILYTNMYYKLLLFINVEIYMITEDFKWTFLHNVIDYGGRKRMIDVREELSLF